MPARHDVALICRIDSRGHPPRLSDGGHAHDAVVVVIDRFAACLGVQAGRERIVERVDPTADAVACLEDSHVPPRVGQVDRRSEPREPRADHHDAGPRARGARKDGRRRRGPCRPVQHRHRRTAERCHQKTAPGDLARRRAGRVGLARHGGGVPHHATSPTGLTATGQSRGARDLQR
jgi:hypothetical protein